MATITGIILTTLIGFLILMMVFGAIVASTEKQVFVENQSMLMLKLDRQIVDRAPRDPFSEINLPGLEKTRKIGLDDILVSIEKARTDDRIRCIYLDLSVINGGMAAVEEIRNSLLAFRDSSDKPIYAYGDMYDQMSFYLATAADKVVLNPKGVVDFRGLGGEVAFYKNALEKLGVEMQVVRHGKFKSAVEPFMLEKMSPENREQKMVYLSSMWNHMLKGISAERNIPVERLNELADRVMTFRKAEEVLATGLVDTLKYKDEVLDDLRKITGIASRKGIPLVTASDYAKVPVKKEQKTPFSRNKIAVIYASGDIGMSMGSEGISGDKLSREIPSKAGLLLQGHRSAYRFSRWKCLRFRSDMERSETRCGREERRSVNGECGGFGWLLHRLCRQSNFRAAQYHHRVDRHIRNHSQCRGVHQ